MDSQPCRDWYCPYCHQLLQYCTCNSAKITYNPSIQENYYDYKCPNCNGEFNSPSYGCGYSSNLIPKCPFCGRIMEGLK